MTLSWAGKLINKLTRKMAKCLCCTHMTFVLAGPFLILEISLSPAGMCFTPISLFVMPLICLKLVCTNFLASHLAKILVSLLSPDVA